MRSRTSERFRKAFDELPEAIQRKARDAYAQWTANPAHPSLRFKKIHDSLPIFSVRVDRGWRVVGILEGDEMIITCPHQMQLDRLREEDKWPVLLQAVDVVS